ncbi:MAG: 4-hydroxythreonine-4-phosphate dehydrogenase PdxA [Pseudomonadota bacterium]
MTLLLSTGEPAGIGPDISLALAADPSVRLPALIALGDAEVLDERARRLGLTLTLERVESPQQVEGAHRPGHLPVWHFSVRDRVEPGVLSTGNAASVLEMLGAATDLCRASPNRHALVTAPVHKGVINDAGVPFTGHTEFLADRAGVPRTVMLLAAGRLRVALATTHLPLAEVSDALTPESLTSTVTLLREGLVERFGLQRPRILVCGLNPHAGEDGHLGREEIDVITPTLARLRDSGVDGLVGPLPADTAFTPRALADADAVLAMYHDQGLGPLKAVGFGEAVNVTLGLPFVRTSVDHGTALDIAGTGAAEHASLLSALLLASELVMR